jgi:hypothetical protein
MMMREAWQSMMGSTLYESVIVARLVNPLSWMPQPQAGRTAKRNTALAWLTTPHPPSPRRLSKGSAERPMTLQAPPHLSLCCQVCYLLCRLLLRRHQANTTQNLDVCAGPAGRTTKGTLWVLRKLTAKV